MLNCIFVTKCCGKSKQIFKSFKVMWYRNHAQCPMLTHMRYSITFRFHDFMCKYSLVIEFPIGHAHRRTARQTDRQTDSQQ